VLLQARWQDGRLDWQDSRGASVTAVSDF
jgi:hypothetical protein